jgi:hypothetical protein
MWEIYFEMCEDYRHKSTVGAVPPEALQWLESHWELLPTNGWEITGTLRGGDGTPPTLHEVEQLVVNDGTVRVVTRTITHPPEVVTL